MRPLLYAVCAIALIGGMVSGCTRPIGKNWLACIVTTPGKAVCQQ